MDEHRLAPRALRIRVTIVRAMEMHRVESSVIAQIGYDGERQRLRIVFHRGGVYDYYMIPRSVSFVTGR